MNKVTWESEQKNIWENELFDTEDECIAQALEFGVDRGETIFIGDCIPYKPIVDIDDILEQLECQASDMCGEVGDDWYISGAREYPQEFETLEKKVQSAVDEYLNSIGEYPTFYKIENIREVAL